MVSLPACFPVSYGVHAQGYGPSDAGTVFALALGLLAQGYGSLSSGFRIASHSRRIHAYRMALFANGDGVQTGSFRAIAYGQCPFAVRYGIVAQGRGAHGPIGMSPGADGQGIGPDSAVIIVIPVAVTVFTLK